MSEKRDWMCHNMACMKTSTIKGQYRVCAACRGVCYCSRECQIVHWKIHKPACQRAREDALGASVTDPGTDRKIVYARPGIIEEKLLEDLNKWVQHHFSWITMCYLNVSDFGNNPQFWKTHGVIVELDVVNTRQSRYRFTFKHAQSAPSAVMDRMTGCQDELHSFKNTTPTIAPDGKALFTTRSLIMCNAVATSIPIWSPLYPADGFAMHVDPNWKENMSRNLKAPLGLSDAVAQAFREWWSKQKSAILFCCANILGRTSGGPVRRENIYFDVMYKEKTLKGSSMSFIFSPLPPIREPLENIHRRVPKGTDHVRKISRVLDKPVNRGKRIMVHSAGIMGTAEHCEVTDADLANIEIRDDWKHHFYTLLVDYDLKY